MLDDTRKMEDEELEGVPMGLGYLVDSREQGLNLQLRVF